MPASTFILLGQRRRLLLPVLQAARTCGYTRRIVVGPAPTRRLRWSTACSRHEAVDLDDPQALLRCLERLARQDPAAVLAPGDCETACLLGSLGSQLPLRTVPLGDAATLQLLDDKAAFHRFCAGHGLPVPPSQVFGSRGALAYAPLAQALGTPFVVKPTRGSGSAGVVVVRCASDLEQQVLRCADYPPGPVIVQRYVPGVDIDVDLVAVGGRLQALAVHRVEGHWMRFVRHPALEAAAEALCRESGYTGPMNIDARLEAGTGAVYLIESNPRYWASITAPAAAGLNFVRETLEPAAAGPHRVLGEGAVDTRHPLLRPAAWRALLRDRGEQGRLLRAIAFDPYALVLLAGQAPGMARRALRRSAAAATRLLRLAGARPSAR